MQIGKVPLSTTHPWGSCWPQFQIEIGSEFSKLVFLTLYKDLIFYLLENAIWISPLHIIFFASQISKVLKIALCISSPCALYQMKTFFIFLDCRLLQVLTVLALPHCDGQVSVSFCTWKRSNNSHVKYVVTAREFKWHTRVSQHAD